jgi:hypothetical protein
MEKYVRLLAFVIEKEYGIKICEDVIEYFIKNKPFRLNNIHEFITFDFADIRGKQENIIGSVHQSVIDYVIKEKKSKEWVLQLSLMCGWIYIEYKE